MSEDLQKIIIIVITIFLKQHNLLLVIQMKLNKNDSCKNIYYLLKSNPIPGPTGPTGPSSIFDNNYALFTNQSPDITSSNTIPLLVQFNGGTPLITSNSDTITLPAPGTYYISFNLSGRIGTNQSGTIIPIINGIPQDRYAITNNTNSTNSDITIGDGILVQAPTSTSIQFFYTGSNMSRANFFASVFKISNN